MKNVMSAASNLSKHHNNAMSNDNADAATYIQLQDERQLHHNSPRAIPTASQSRNPFAQRGGPKQGPPLSPSLPPHRVHPTSNSSYHRLFGHTLDAMYRPSNKYAPSHVPIPKRFTFHVPQTTCGISHHHATIHIGTEGPVTPPKFTHSVHLQT
jgi:hypothetical protein